MTHGAMKVMHPGCRASLLCSTLWEVGNTQCCGEFMKEEERRKRRKEEKEAEKKEGGARKLREVK